MESKRIVAPVAPNPGPRPSQDLLAPREHPPEDMGSLATPLLSVLAVVCCAGPPVVAALAAAGGGAWLAGRGYTLGASALIVLAALLTWRIAARISH